MSIISVFAVLLLVMLLGMVMNVSRQVDGKIRLQNAADAAAYSGGVVLARGMNTLAFTNHLLCEVFALTAYMREARDLSLDADNNAQYFAKQILDAWRDRAMTLMVSDNPDDVAAGQAIRERVPVEQELVDRFSEFAKESSRLILPVLEMILKKELIPEFQQAVVQVYPEIAQAAAMEIAARNGQPEQGRGRLQAAVWQPGASSPSNDLHMPVIGQWDSGWDAEYVEHSGKKMRDKMARFYLNSLNNRTLVIFSGSAKLCQFFQLDVSGLWGGFTCGHLENLLRVEYLNRNMLYMIRREVSRSLTGGLPAGSRDAKQANDALRENFSFVGVAYWKQLPEYSTSYLHHTLFKNPMDSDSLAFAEVRVFLPRTRVRWGHFNPSGGTTTNPLGGVPGDMQEIPGDYVPPGGPSYWEPVREKFPWYRPYTKAPSGGNGSAYWDCWDFPRGRDLLLTQNWSVQLVPVVEPELATMLQSPPGVPNFDGTVRLPHLQTLDENQGKDPLAEITTH